MLGFANPRLSSYEDSRGIAFLAYRQALVLIMSLTLVRLAAATCLLICVGLRCPGVLCDLACASGNLEVKAQG